MSWLFPTLFAWKITSEEGGIEPGCGGSIGNDNSAVEEFNRLKGLGAPSQLVL